MVLSSTLHKSWVCGRAATLCCQEEMDGWRERWAPRSAWELQQGAETSLWLHGGVCIPLAGWGQRCVLRDLLYWADVLLCFAPLHGRLGFFFVWVFLITAGSIKTVPTPLTLGTNSNHGQVKSTLFCTCCFLSQSTQPCPQDARTDPNSWVGIARQRKTAETKEASPTGGWYCQGTDRSNTKLVTTHSTRDPTLLLPACQPSIQKPFSWVTQELRLNHKMAEACRWPAQFTESAALGPLLEAPHHRTAAGWQGCTSAHPWLSPPVSALPALCWTG